MLLLNIAGRGSVEEKEIMARTFHCSIESVRQYKRASDDMMKEVPTVFEPKRFRKSDEPTSTITTASLDSPRSMDVDN
uniref:Uncharacterized protein n=1 Tax=Magallana gigas TaxID=29159 RepID=A0A8W8JFL2_MAGGI